MRHYVFVDLAIMSFDIGSVNQINQDETRLKPPHCADKHLHGTQAHIPLYQALVLGTRGASISFDITLLYKYLVR
jgi:hypothetical protein